MSTYLGWTVIDLPIYPDFPASLEFQNNPITGANTNPFTGEQTIQYWNPGFLEASVSIQPMTVVQAQPWIVFLTALQGMANVFQFGADVCAAFPLELTSDGTIPRYWRLKTNATKWSIKPGVLYSVSFEVREAT
jgi:hypothetical protein